MASTKALLRLLLEGSCAVYKTLITDSKLVTSILKILTESAHNYLYQDLSSGLNDKQRKRLRRHRKFLRQLASSNSVRGKAKSYKVNLLLNNRAAAKAIIEPLLSSLKNQAQLERFENVSKVPASPSESANGDDISATSVQAGSSPRTFSPGSYSTPSTSDHTEAGVDPAVGVKHVS